MRVRTKHTTRGAFAVAGVTLALGISGPVMLAAAQPADTRAPTATTTVDVARRPTVPTEYARAAYRAWLTDDARSVIDLSALEVVQLLAAHPADGDGWSAAQPQCEGAAGSTYCTWVAESKQLTMRVDNASSSTGTAHAVTEASFTHAPSAIALWPLTTMDEAWNTQGQVDAGHSPWMVDPQAVVSSYASTLGFAEPVVDERAPTFFTYRVVDGATGAAVDVEVAQPVRGGAGGIWVVVRVTSSPSHAAVVPLTDEPALAGVPR